MTNADDVRKHTDELREKLAPILSVLLAKGARAGTEDLPTQQLFEMYVKEALSDIESAFESLFQKELEAQVERAEKAARLDERNKIGAFLNKLVDQDVDHELEASDVVYQYGEDYQKSALEGNRHE